MNTTQRIQEIGYSIEEQIIENRRYFHANPEISLEEFETKRVIAQRLASLGIHYKFVAGTGVVGTIKGEAEGSYDDNGKPAFCLALRADIDALPMQELTDFAYKSKTDGVAHTCGHDCHIAMLLGAADILSRMKDQIKGEVRLIFQPAEEITKGAKAMIEAGALKGVDSIFGMHIWSELEAGAISCPPGHRMASTDWFRIDIEGESAHGSMPHKGVDAIVVASELVVALQVVVSRDISPFEPVVVTIGEIHGGSARNIMAGSAYLAGTTRTWTPKSRAEMPQHIERIVNHVASGLGATATLTWEEGHQGLTNDRTYAKMAESSIAKLFGEDAVSDYEGTMAGEDFSDYLVHVPGVFAFLGTKNPSLGAVHPQHSCYYTVDESVLVKGAMFTAQYALDCLS